MCEIKVEKILSVSSEDPAFPAESLLKKDGKNSKWKTKSPGERHASIVLQLEKATKIEGLDIGNENSAFIEVLVGKSCNETDNFKVLLVTSSLMTLKEAKDGVNVNSVRFFKTSDFCKPECDEKWDRVKIVCTQPYNKYVKFGIAFINIHGEKKKEPSLGMFGKFALKDESESDIQVGSIFARRKDLLAEPPPKTGAVAIRAATKDIIGSQSPLPATPKVKKVSKKNYNTPSPASTSKLPAAKKNNDSSIASSTTNTSQASKNDKAKNNPESSVRKKTKDPAGERAKRNVNTPSTSASKVTRPFKQLLQNVVFVISGFQNPLRGDIRQKALSMGAKYKADWDSSCTHLVCAFTNTPKFNQVRGQGKIVKKEWIEDSYSRRIRFPWRRYALDKGDMQRAESEEEVYEEEEASRRTDNRRRVQSSDEEEEVGEMEARAPTKPPAKPVPMFPQLPTNNKPNGVLAGGQAASDFTPKAKPKRAATSPVPKSPKKKIKQEEEEEVGPAAPPVALVPADLGDVDTGGDTQSDPEWEGYVQQSCHPLPYLPEQFTDLTFFISSDYTQHEEQKIHRYIISHSGVVVPEIETEAEYIIAENPETMAKWKEKFPQVVGVKSEWIWRCHDENRLLPTSTFEL